MQFYKGKIVHLVDKISTTGKNYQLIYLLVGEEVFPITNWRNDKLYEDDQCDVKMLVQTKNSFRTVFKLLKN